jgi:K+-transporting ATPase ATPase C chain
MTGLAQSLFSDSANGSLLRNAQGVVIGSRLIGQPFTQPQYFWSRPSATQPVPYNASASAGSPFGPSHPALLQQVVARIAALQPFDPDNPLPIPVDLVTRSGSGLDPHISVAAARYQTARIARQRQLASDQIEALLQAHIEPRQFGVLGEPRVNVVLLNRALDAMHQ